MLLLRWFDRRGERGRIGYISAMTAVGSDDGDHRDYVDVVGADVLPDEPEGLLALARDCGLSLPEAKERMSRIVGSLSGWPERAYANGAREREVTMMAESIRPRLEAVARAARSAS